MKYAGYLIGKNGKKYTVEILTNATISSWEMASTPIQLDRDGIVTTIDGADDVFRPLKLGGATISIFGKEMLLDIFSPKSNGTAVRVVDGDGVAVWCGYAQPSVYSQDLSDKKTTLEVECNDCLSILKEIDFATINQNGMTTVLQYLQKAVEIAGGNSYSLMLKICEPFDGLLLEKIIIQEGNWFDESDEPSKWSDVLESILQYLNMQIVQVGSEIRAYKLNALLNTGRPNYFGSRIINLDELKCEANPTISLTEVYQKIKATVSLYSKKDILPDLFGKDSEMIGVDRVAMNNGKKTYQRYFSFIKNPAVKTYAYNKLYMTSVEQEFTVAAMKSRIGAWQVVSRIHEYEEPEFGGWENTLVNSLTSENYFVIARHSSVNSDMNYSTNFPMLTVKQKMPIVFGDNYGILLSADVNYTPEEIPIFRTDNKPEQPYIEQGWRYIICSLRVGNKWFNHTDVMNNPMPYTSLWQDTFTTFKIFLSSGADVRYEWWASIWKDLMFRNNVSWETGIADKGFYLPIRGVDSLGGDIEFTIYGIPGPNTKVEYMWIKNLNIKIVKSGWYAEGDVEQDDVEYENVIDKANASEMSEIQLNVATDVGRDFSLASAILKNSNSMEFLKEVTDKVTSESAICEQLMINSYHKQYCEPRKQIEYTLSNILVEPTECFESANMNASFIVDSITNHLEDDKSEVKLIELV